MSIFDIPDATQNILIDVADKWASGQLLTISQINAYLLSLGSHFSSQASFQSASIAAGVVTVERQARFTYVDLRNEGLAFTDELTTLLPLSPTVFVDGDEVYFRQATFGQQTRIVAGGNIIGNNGIFTLMDNYFYSVVMVRGAWMEGKKFPQGANEQIGVLSDFADIPIPPSPAEVFAIRSKLNLLSRDLGSEVLATAEVEITAASGTSGAISVHVDYGFGSFKIGEASYSSATTVGAVYSDLETSIDTGGSGFTAAPTTPMTISAPVGTGLSGDNIQLFIVVTGGIAATSDTAFSGGADAPENDAILDTINGIVEGKLVFVRNAMGANSITINPGSGIGVSYPYRLKGGELILFVGEGSDAVPFFSESQTRNITSVTTTYTVLPTDRIVRVDATAAPVTIDLPLAAEFPEGVELVIKKHVTTVNAVTLDGNGSQTIDGATTATVVSCTVLYRVGNSWEIQSAF